MMYAKSHYLCMFLRRFRSFIFRVKCILVGFLSKVNVCHRLWLQSHHVQFCFPWKNVRPVKTWKWESLCADGARSYFINPRKPCYQEAGTTATGSEKGDFPPSCSVRMQNNAKITHIHNDYWLGYFLCVLIHTRSQQVALWALSPVISARWLSLLVV